MSGERSWVSEISWIIEGELAAFSIYTLADLARLQAAGIGAIVSLTEHFPEELVGERDFVTLHLPLEDMTAPNMDQIESFVIFGNRMRAQEIAVGVHCLAGLGRTGTLIACYLVTHGMCADDAIAQVRRLRPGSVQTEGQERAVHRWAQRHASDEGIVRFL